MTGCPREVPLEPNAASCETASVPPSTLLVINIVIVRLITLMKKLAKMESRSGGPQDDSLVS